MKGNYIMSKIIQENDIIENEYTDDYSDNTKYPAAKILKEACFNDYKGVLDVYDRIYA